MGGIGRKKTGPWQKFKTLSENNYHSPHPPAKEKKKAHASTRDHTWLTHVQLQEGVEKPSVSRYLQQPQLYL
jgi:hypothetical protein